MNYTFKSSIYVCICACLSASPGFILNILLILNLQFALLVPVGIDC